MKPSMPPRRRWPTHLALAAAALLPLAGHAQGDCPTKPIRLVAPYPAGGLTDPLAHQLAEGLSRRLGQQAVVENKGGAGGISSCTVFTGTAALTSCTCRIAARDRW